MERLPFLRVVFIVFIAIAGVLPASAGIAEDQKLSSTAKGSKGGIYLQLTEDFYRAMQAETDSSRRYSTQMSDTYLRQIAVSSRFMVETNLQILRQQEKMIQLLEEMRRTGK